MPRASSVASAAGFHEQEVKLAPAVEYGSAASKRKAQDASAEPDKKRKHHSPRASSSKDLRPWERLPPAVWQHLFLFCSLSDLGRLMQVNRSFFSYLTDVCNVSASEVDVGCLRLLKSESIWASARNMYFPRPPKPLAGFTELQMWQLAWSKRCQFCNKSTFLIPGDQIWKQGPGDTGVRTVWPFGIRACGPCLLQQSHTDASLLFSPTASALRPALPFALITQHQHYVPAHLLQSTNIPADVEVSKYYYKVHIDDMTSKLNEALGRGPAAAEEWSKGLATLGKDRMAMADKWEKWDIRSRAELKRTSSMTATPQAPSPVIHTPVPVAPPSQLAHARPPTAPPQVFTPQPPHLVGSTQPSHQRNIHDANEAKAARKLDIERRCQQMDPPIPPNLLRHMDSFKAALQISQPMNDYAWSLLQPRLVAQLTDAQHAETDHVSRAASLAIKTSERRHQDVNTKETKELMDREWDEAQRPIRDELNVIADELIDREWDHGRTVTYENSPKFAADLLVHARRKYLGDAVEETEPHETSNGPGSTNDTSSKPRLVLENMKWVYDNKIKPLTEQFRKELYLCNANICENGQRYYGFEGIVQHYGAKHTHSFSSGNVVVAWREAEWPEETPFHPDPIAQKQTFHITNAAPYGAYAPYPRVGTTTPHMQPHMPPASPGSFTYPHPYNGPFPPPQSTPGFDYHAYGPPVDSFGHPPMGPPRYPSQAGGPSYIPSPALGNPTVPPPVPMQPLGHSTSALPEAADDSSHSTSAFDKQVSTITEMALELWKLSSGIKDMPNSLRVYILLHSIIFRFHVEFNHEPNLNHFIDALSHHDIPRPLRNSPGLSCKTCQVEASSQLTGAYYAKPVDRKTYTVIALLTHFRSQHLSIPQYNFGTGHSIPTPDWKENMIELPGDRFISGLIHAPGMDDDKLLMIATVFPSLFPWPLPKTGSTNNGLISPSASDSKDERDMHTPGVTTQGDVDPIDASSSSVLPIESTRPPKAQEDDVDAQGSGLTDPSTSSKLRSARESPGDERRHRYYPEPRYYMSRDSIDDGYAMPREYVEYAPSPRIIHSGLAYGEYSGRRTVFREREQERIYGPPREDVPYGHAREGSNGRDYGSYSRQSRYYEDDGPRPEVRYVRDAQGRDESPSRGQSAADRFLDDFVPGSNVEPSRANEADPNDAIPAVAREHADEGTRLPSPVPNVPTTEDPGFQNRQLAATLPKAPSTVSNGSRYEEYHPHGYHIQTPDSLGPPRRVGAQRRRDRPHEQRMPSRYYRYMSVARDESFGRGPSMSRSQSRRYEEQRRRIDQQETPHPRAEREYEPAYSRDHSVERPSPDKSFYHRPSSREYVSVQDRMPYSPPRYRYDDARGPPAPMYVDEYGHPVHEYEVVRVRGDHRHQRASYAPYPQPPRYEPERYEYVPVSHDRPHQRYNSRGEYYYVEERSRGLPRRPVPEAEAEQPEPPPPEIKVESVPVPLPEGA